MASFLDTSVLARYLVQDHPELGRRAAALIDSSARLSVSLVILTELAFVLTRHYRIGRKQVVAALTELALRENIETHEAPSEVAVEALEMCAPSGRISFADAMAWAIARTSSDATVWSFDRRFPTRGITLREP